MLSSPNGLAQPTLEYCSHMHTSALLIPPLAFPSSVMLLDEPMRKATFEQEDPDCWLRCEMCKELEPRSWLCTAMWRCSDAAMTRCAIWHQPGIQDRLVGGKKNQNVERCQDSECGTMSNAAKTEEMPVISQPVFAQCRYTLLQHYQLRGFVYRLNTRTARYCFSHIRLILKVSSS